MKNKDWLCNIIKTRKPAVFSSDIVIDFVKKGKLPLLINIFSFLVIPEKTFLCIKQNCSGCPFEDLLYHRHYVKVINFRNPYKSYEFPPSIPEEKGEALATAMDLEGVLVTEDKVLIQEAKAKGIPVITKDDILLYACKKSIKEDEIVKKANTLQEEYQYHPFTFDWADI